MLSAPKERRGVQKDRNVPKDPGAWSARSVQRDLSGLHANSEPPSDKNGARHNRPEPAANDVRRNVSAGHKPATPNATAELSDSTDNQPKRAQHSEPLGWSARSVQSARGVQKHRSEWRDVRRVRSSVSSVLRDRSVHSG